MKEMTRELLLLEPNTFPHFYGGGLKRREFLGERDKIDDQTPEEWICSCSRAMTPGGDNTDPRKGFSTVTARANDTPVYLADLIERFPVEMLGERHVATFGPNLGLLVKLLDIGMVGKSKSRIPVHVHPSRDQVKKWLKPSGCAFGKAEAWHIIDTRQRQGATVWLGFHSSLTTTELKALIEQNSAKELLAAMHQYTVKAGQTIFIPAGLPHALGYGVVAIEPQEPTDYSILAEGGKTTDGQHYPFDRKRDGHAGFGWRRAITVFDRTGYTKEEIKERCIRRPTAGAYQEGPVRSYSLLRAEEARFFEMSRYVLTEGATLELLPAGPAVFVALQGHGSIEPLTRRPSCSIACGRGSRYFVPSNIGRYRLHNRGSGTFEFLWIMPPDAGGQGGIA